MLWFVVAEGHSPSRVRSVYSGPQRAHSFLDALYNAKGRQEFVIAVVVDIRGFAAFSLRNDSSNIALFVRRFYLEATTRHFSAANFIKATGDGLLLVFSYSEENLRAISENVIDACLACLKDFPNICNSDPMIDFPVPQEIGFGIARGSACCIYSGKNILDYSGHILNLASGLNQLASPSGIVVDGSFLPLSKAYKGLFKQRMVYLRGIAENIPRKILYLDNWVRIPNASRAPLADDKWKTITRSFTKGQLAEYGSTLNLPLTSQVKSMDRLHVTITVPEKGIKDITRDANFTDFAYIEQGSYAMLAMNLDKARKQISADSLVRNARIKFEIEYVPKAFPPLEALTKSG